MANRFEMYVCDLCGNVVDVVEEAAGVLACCGQDMTLQTENTTDAAQEKHVPVVTVIGNTVSVQVGSVDHPMTEAHYIPWIELRQGNKLQRIYLTPSDEPKAVFAIDAAPGPQDAPIFVRASCNLHGLWKN